MQQRLILDLIRVESLLKIQATREEKKESDVIASGEKSEIILEATWDGIENPGEIDRHPKCNEDVC